jgi:exopolyphosphatase/pppGpp-phosphohydrolase
MKIAAIDIGSNAARLLIVDVIVNKQRVAELIR